MSVYRMEDGTVVKTENAQKSWEEEKDHDGRNWISRATNDQWTHQQLYKSRKGRYYLEHTSQVQGSRAWCEWISPQQAAAWLLLMEYELPDDLRECAKDIEE